MGDPSEDWSIGNPEEMAQADGVEMTEEDYAAGM